MPTLRLVQVQIESSRIAVIAPNPMVRGLNQVFRL
jgi:hypothetical protein